MTTNISLDAMIAQADWESLTRPSGEEVMSEHTPGPWHIEHPHINCLEIRDSAGGYVAELTKESGSEPPPLMEINARLIASAPEMLEALRKLLHPDNEALVYFVPSDAHAMHLRDKARTAIAKATGAA